MQYVLMQPVDINLMKFNTVKHNCQPSAFVKGRRCIPWPYPKAHCAALASPRPAVAEIAVSIHAWYSSSHIRQLSRTDSQHTHRGKILAEGHVPCCWHWWGSCVVAKALASLLTPPPGLPAPAAHGRTTVNSLQYIPICTLSELN